MPSRLRSFQQIASSAFALAKQIEEETHQQYRHLEQRTGFWAMIDLQGSAAYRQQYGVENALTRAVVLSELIKRLIVGYPGKTEVFKELGDGVLVHATEFRSLVEILIVVDAVREYWNVDVANDETYLSLESRTAVTFGDTHVLGGDYLGQPVDEVARLTGFKSENSLRLAVVSAEVRARTETQFEREYPFLRFGENFELPSKLGKPGERALWASELLVDRARRRDFSDFFMGARAVLGDGLA